MSQNDIQTLFNNKIFYEDEQMVQAIMFQEVVRVCYYYGINLGSVWTSAHQQYLKARKN
ncbi:hypothetical protein Hanom_Chr10g00894651 [Helianthus anomalus]